MHRIFFVKNFKSFIFVKHFFFKYFLICAKKFFAFFQNCDQNMIKCQILSDSFLAAKNTWKNLLPLIFQGFSVILLKVYRLFFPFHFVHSGSHFDFLDCAILIFRKGHVFFKSKHLKQQFKSKMNPVGSSEFWTE